MRRQAKVAVAISAMLLTLALSASVAPAVVAPPSVTKPGSTPLGAGEVGLGGFVNPHESAISDCRFEYGPDAGYGQSVPCDVTPPADTKPNLVRAQLAGLAPGSTYHYRLVATNAVGSDESEDGVFTVASAPAPESCSNDGALGTAFLPECRAWEMVSPPDKRGIDVMTDTRRTRVATDGDSASFAALGAFADATLPNIIVDYLSERSSDPTPGGNGWSTHAISPEQDPVTLRQRQLRLEPMNVGPFSPDLSRTVFQSNRPLTDEPIVAEAGIHLYVQTNLHAAGGAGAELVSDCPACTTPLPPPPDQTANRLMPAFGGANAGLSRVLFQSRRPLTADLPAVDSSLSRVYEWRQEPSAGGEHVFLAGILPDGSAADLSIPGSQRATEDFTDKTFQPNVVSDGSDGHTRVFWTRPSVNRVSPDVDASSGDVYMRLDGSSTVQLNVPEPGAPAGWAPALWVGATPDGSRAFFVTGQRLTPNAPFGTFPKLYAYDTTKPASAPDNLALLSVDSEPADKGAVGQVIGSSDDGSYVYFWAKEALTPDAPLGNGIHIYVWHEGTVTYVSGQQSGAGGDLDQVTNSAPRDARVTPDGRYLLFVSESGKDVLSTRGGADYNHGAGANREFYLYDALQNSIACVTCNPTGEAATVDARLETREDTGGADGTSIHVSPSMTDDGRLVYFSSAERLIPRDTNGVTDAYLYDSTTGQRQLVSSGRDSHPSYAAGIAPDGTDAFVFTVQRLSGWDFDGSADLYDARVGGGFPEPPLVPPACEGDACQGSVVPPEDVTPSSATLRGPGDPSPQANSRRGRRCGKGKRSGRSKRAAKNKRAATGERTRRKGAHKCPRRKAHRKHRRAGK